SGNQTFHYRFIAANSNGVAQGGDMSFTTLTVVAPTAPSATTLAAIGMTGSGATLQATANPNGSAAGGYFQWGLSDTYGNVTGVQSIGAGVSNITVASQLAGLLPGTVYHYRAAATNAGGMGFGVDATFTTLAQPKPTAIIFDGVNDAVVVPDS